MEIHHERNTDVTRLTLMRLKSGHQTEVNFENLRSWQYINLNSIYIFCSRRSRRRQVYFSMVAALRKGHYRREWQDHSEAGGNVNSSHLVTFCQDSKNFRRPFLLPVDLDSRRSTLDVAWYMALVWGFVETTADAKRTPRNLEQIVKKKTYT